MDILKFHEVSEFLALPPESGFTPASSNMLKMSFALSTEACLKQCNTSF